MIIEAFEEFKAEYSNGYGLCGRIPFVKKYAWAVPDKEAISLIASFGPIVEMGAGAGYWSYLLRKVGVDVVAYDEAPYKNAWCDFEDGWTEVLVGGTQKASEHPDRALFLCWPPYDHPMASETLKAYLKAGGRTLIYVGEGSGGCTGDYEFHDLLIHMKPIAGHNIPSWFGIHDELVVYRAR